MYKAFRSAKMREDWNHWRLGRRGWLAIAGFALLCCGILFGNCPALHAQNTTGSFNGHVYDASRSVVVNAKVVLHDVQNGLMRNATTNSDGLYEFPLVKPGTYQLTVTAAGFGTEVKPNLVLDVNQIQAQDFTLKIGTATQTVSVSASAQQLQTSSANLGAVVDERTVGDLPLNGRSFSALLTLTPGENPVNYSQNSGVTVGTGQGSPGIPGSTYTFPSTQGQWNRENMYFLDGIVNTAAFSSSWDVPPIIDSMQEFKLQSHEDQSEYGGVLGGVVNVVSKSGTNTFHGAAWEYLRNNAFDSRNPFTDFNGNTPSAPAPYHQNEFGADFGGPVRIPKIYNGKNKTFFFVAWESWRYSKAAGISYISPTANELNGDFTNAAVLTSTGQPALLYNPFLSTGTSRPLLGNGHVIPAGMIDPNMQAYLKAYTDTPNFTPSVAGGNNTILNAVGTNDANAFSGRVDHNFNNNMIWFRYSFIDSSATQPTGQHALSTSSADDRNFGGGYAHTFSPHLVLDTTIGYSGRWKAGYNDTTPGAPASAAAFLSAVAKSYGTPNFTFTGYNGAGGQGAQENVEHELSFAVNTTWTHGNHLFRFGFFELISQENQGVNGANFGSATFAFDQTGTADPTNQGATGNGIASALLGVPTSGRFQAEVNSSRIISPSAYVEDQWKVSPRVTLNLGLRWDGESSPHLLNGTTAAEIDPNTGNWIISGGKLPPPCNPAGGVYAPCIPTVSSYPGLSPSDAAVLQAHVVVAANPNLGPDPVYTDFGPHIGIAYQPTDKIAIRGGYGLAFDNSISGIQSVRDRLLAWPSNASMPLNFNSISTVTPTTMTQVIPNIGGTQILPTAPTPWQQYGWNYDPKLKNAYSHQFNLDIQDQVTSTLLVSAGYVGSIDRRLPVTGLSNNSPDPGGAGLDRPFQWGATAVMATSRGTSSYNSLQLRADKRLSGGLNFGSGFTWSKAMDNGGGGMYDTEDGPLGFATMQNYNDLNANRGITSNSVKFIWYGYSLYQLPFGPHQRWLNHGLGAATLGGWQANVTASAHSGVPLGFPDAGSDPANIGNTIGFNYARANVSGSPKVSHPTKAAAFNTAVFSHPVNEYGNSGRGMITAMPFDNVDFSLMKDIPVRESFKFQFRGEFFNLFNIQNYGTPGTTYGGGGFGIITSLAPGATPRQIQLSLRASF